MVIQFKFLRYCKIQFIVLIALLGYSLCIFGEVWARDIESSISIQKNKSLSHLEPVARIPVQLVVTDKPCTIIHLINPPNIHQVLSGGIQQQMNIRNVIRAEIDSECIGAQNIDFVKNKCVLNFVNEIDFSKFKFIKVSDHSLIYDSQNKYTHHVDLEPRRMRVVDFVHLLRRSQMCAYIIPI